MRKEIKDLLDYTRFIVKDTTNRILIINMLIYYAQYLSIEDRWKPLVWANFFNINGVPYMAPLMVESSVDYSVLTTCAEPSDINVQHFIQLALVDITDVYKQLGIDGVRQFVGGVCDIQGRPSVDPYHMLYYALKSKDKIDRANAKQTMLDDETSKRYTTIVRDDSGEPKTIVCTKYAQ